MFPFFQQSAWQLCRDHSDLDYCDQSWSALFQGPRQLSKELKRMLQSPAMEYDIEASAASADVLICLSARQQGLRVSWLKSAGGS